MRELWIRLGRLLLIWTLVTSLGGAMAYGIFLGLSSLQLTTPFLDYGVRLAAAGAFGGALTGSLQAWSLGELWDAGGWVAATAAGWLVALPLAVGLSAWLAPIVADYPGGFRLTSALTAAGLAGLAAAAWQWTILRRRLARSVWWLLANAIGFLMAWVLVLSVGLFLGSGSPLPTTMARLAHGLVLGGAAGFVIGLEQGVALVGLFAQEAWER